MVVTSPRVPRDARVRRHVQFLSTKENIIENNESIGVAYVGRGLFVQTVIALTPRTLLRWCSVCWFPTAFAPGLGGRADDLTGT